MSDIVYLVNRLPMAIPIGVQTESGVESVAINVSAWQQTYGMLDYEVWATRPGEGAAYPVKHFEVLGSILYWYPDETDTAIQGTGKMEILATSQDKRKLSGWCETVINASSLVLTQDPPQVVIPWLEEVKDAAEEAKNQADRAQNIADNLSGGAVSGAVRYDTPQQLTDAQKAQARANIGAGTGSGSGDGTPGADGKPGEDGGYYTPTVVDGVLTWEASKDSMPAVPSADIRGPAGPAGQTGPQGEPGSAGQSATIRVGTVTTLSPGSKATVKNVGTESAAVLDFGIPRGADGAGGADGKPGEDGGYYTPTVVDGVLTWEASKDDMPAVPSADIRGPAGPTGAAGQTGPQGPAGADGYTPQKGVDYFDGTPGNDGTSVTIRSISESTSDGGTSVITFSDGSTLRVKNGSKGSQGDPGSPGQDGERGPAGADGYTPVKGVDYWTAADKQSMVNDVLAALPVYNGEVADA